MQTEASSSNGVNPGLSMWNGRQNGCVGGTVPAVSAVTVVTPFPQIWFPFLCFFSLGVQIDLSSRLISSNIEQRWGGNENVSYDQSRSRDDEALYRAGK